MTVFIIDLLGVSQSIAIAVFGTLFLKELVNFGLSITVLKFSNIFTLFVLKFCWRVK